MALGQLARRPTLQSQLTVHHPQRLLTNITVGPQVTRPCAKLPIAVRRASGRCNADTSSIIRIKGLGSWSETCPRGKPLRTHALSAPHSTGNHTLRDLRINRSSPFSENLFEKRRTCGLVSLETVQMRKSNHGQARATSAESAGDKEGDMGTVIVWLKRDLRLDDHPGFAEALAARGALPVYVFDVALVRGSRCHLRFQNVCPTWFPATHCLWSLTECQCKFVGRRR